MTYAINVCATFQAILEENCKVSAPLARVIARSYTSLVESDTSDFAGLLHRLDAIRAHLIAEYGGK